MLISEVAEKIMKEVYSLFYFTVPKLPEYSSKQKRGFKLKESQFCILLFLETVSSREKKEINCAGIAKSTLYSPQKITRETNELEKISFIKKVHLPPPRANKVRIKILSKGLKALLKEKERRRASFEKMLVHLADQERETLLVFFRKMVEGGSVR